MKNIKIYLEEAGIAATPANTMGMGNPMPPTEGQPGSEPIEPTAKCKKEKCKKCKKKSLKESLLDDEDSLIKNTGDYINIKRYLESNYFIKGSYEIDNNIVNVNGWVIAHKNIKQLTDGFSFGKTINFYCSGCTNLTSLEGAPEKVKCSFDCSNCPNLISLKGCPKEVGSFDCSGCNITSLEGAPKKVSKYFSCNYCENLKSLKGAPEKVNKDFLCNYCKNLTSLEGAPKEIKGNLFCEQQIGRKFTEDKIKKYSNVKGNIYV